MHSTCFTLYLFFFSLHLSLSLSRQNLHFTIRSFRSGTTILPKIPLNLRWIDTRILYQTVRSIEIEIWCFKPLSIRKFRINEINSIGKWLLLAIYVYNTAQTAHASTIKFVQMSLISLLFFLNRKNNRNKFFSLLFFSRSGVRFN